MQNAVSEKIPSGIEVKFIFRNKVCSGIILNLTKNSILIYSKLSPPADLTDDFKILVLFQEKRLVVPVRIKKLSLKDSSSNIIAVDVLNPSKDYLELVSDQRPFNKSFSIHTRRLLGKIDSNSVQ
jgi:hypothetical protein